MKNACRYTPRWFWHIYNERLDDASWATYVDNMRGFLEQCVAPAAMLIQLSDSMEASAPQD